MTRMSMSPAAGTRAGIALQRCVAVLPKGPARGPQWAASGGEGGRRHAFSLQGLAGRVIKVSGIPGARGANVSVHTRNLFRKNKDETSHSKPSRPCRTLQGDGAAISCEEPKMICRRAGPGSLRAVIPVNRSYQKGFQSHKNRGGGTVTSACAISWFFLPLPDATFPLVQGSQTGRLFPAHRFP